VLYWYCSIFIDSNSYIGKKKIPIWVQQDNAAPHACTTDPEVVAAGAIDGWDIKLRFQPPKSPDFNVLDLGLFNAIQSRQYQVDSSKTEELLTSVTESFHAIPSHTIAKCFLTLQKVMETTIRHNGDNNYQLPRISRVHIRNGVLPFTLPCDRQVYEVGKAALKQM
jgi:hypothetical protein